MKGKLFRRNRILSIPNEKCDVPVANVTRFLFLNSITINTWTYFETIICHLGWFSYAQNFIYIMVIVVVSVIFSLPLFVLEDFCEITHLKTHDYLVIYIDRMCWCVQQRIESHIISMYYSSIAYVYARWEKDTTKSLINKRHLQHLHPVTFRH